VSATVPFADLRRQHDALRPVLDPAIARVLDRGWFILGEEVRAFEEEFAAWCGARHAVGVASGTDAITVTLMALGIGAGDEVVTVPNVSAPTASAIVAAGARPVFVDVDPITRNLDAAGLLDVLTERTRAIVPVHLYGRPCDIDAVLAVAGPRGIAVIEDAAQAHGARFRARSVGTLASAACFSFYPTKNLGAAGDAGMVLTDDAGVAARARMIREYGQERRYHNRMHGRNSRLDELQAAILRVKLPHVHRWNARRREIAARYDDGLRDTALRLPERLDADGHVFHLYVVESEDRDGFRERCRERGVETAVHYPIPLHLQPCYRPLGYAEGAFPVAERLCRTVVSLPMFPELTDEEVDCVIRAGRDAA
jgi:dTDP-4-amino-4,6-dideoxygalactose transaminase